MGWTVPRAKKNSIHVKSHIRNRPDFVRVSFPHRVRVRLESTTGTATAVVPVASTADKQTSWYSPQKGQGSPIHGRHGKHRSSRRFRVLCAGKALRDKNLSGCHLLLSSVSPPCSRIHDKQGKRHGARGFRMSVRRRIPGAFRGIGHTNLKTEVCTYVAAPLSTVYPTHVLAWFQVSWQRRIILV